MLRMVYGLYDSYRTSSHRSKDLDLEKTFDFEPYVDNEIDELKTLKMYSAEDSGLWF